MNLMGLNRREVCKNRFFEVLPKESCHFLGVLGIMLLRVHARFADFETPQMPLERKAYRQSV